MLPRSVSQHEFWRAPLVKSFLAERIARRVASEEWDRHERRGPADVSTGVPRSPFERVDALLREAPVDYRPQLLRGLELALDGKAQANTPPPLMAAFERLAKEGFADDNLFRPRVRFNHGDALKEAHARLADPKRPDAEKEKLIQLLGQVRRAESLLVLTGLFREGKSDKLRA